MCYLHDYSAIWASHFYSFKPTVHTPPISNERMFVWTIFSSFSGHLDNFYIQYTVYRYVYCKIWVICIAQFEHDILWAHTFMFSIGIGHIFMFEQFLNHYEPIFELFLIHCLKYTPFILELNFMFLNHFRLFLSQTNDIISC